MTRKRNPRVVMREKLMEAKRWLHTMTTLWDCGTQRYVPDGERKPGEPYMRKREKHEYPENRPEDLRQLIEYVRAIRVRCTEVEAMAFRRLLELEEGTRRG